MKHIALTGGSKRIEHPYEDKPATYNGKAKHAPFEHFLRVQPGFTRVHLAGMFAKRGFTTGAEVGVADGRYSLTLCKNIPNLSLLCVDLWAPYHGNRRGGPQEQHERNYALAVERLAPYQARLRRGYSLDVVREVPLDSLDFVYIDANHAFDYVMCDIIEWAKRVRSGGIVAGHDFYWFDGAGVVEAVEVYTKAHRITDWYVCDEREPSFWWGKR